MAYSLDNSKKICSIEGCNRPTRAHGWCLMHHGRWRRHGDPMVLKQRPNGSGTISKDGYVRFRSKENKDGKREHVLIAEKALGMPLPKLAVVHHVNEVPGDNRNENLVICQDERYHNLLHKRMRALCACGNANWLKCKICKQYDAREHLYIESNDRHHWHRACLKAKRKGEVRVD